MDPRPPAIPTRYLTLSLLFLALLAMGQVLLNQWVQDDTGIILHNYLVKDLAGTWKAFGRPYWPGGEFRELYRPLMISLFSIQWWLGDGATWVFRVVNLLCYGAAILAVWALLRRLTTIPAAWVGAALFAVHPVHVEAVAVSVNQGETLVAAILSWACCIYLDWRRGLIPFRQAFVWIVALYLPALFIKEHALILPGFLLALELSVLWAGTDRRALVRTTGVLFATLFAIGAAFWTIRRGIIGPGTGTAAQELLEGLTLPGRAITMLGVVPEWLRLLLWPAHLQMEWSPFEYAPYYAWSLRETLGVVALASLTLALILSWGRRPRITLALLWMAVGIFPVSNLAIPTGVIIAERTLFLASIGVAIAAADLAELLFQSAAMARREVRSVVLGAMGLLICVGMLASSTRMLTWRNRLLFISSAVQDAPLSFRTHMSWGVLLIEVGDTAAGARELERAFDLHSHAIGPFIRFSKELRRETGDCRSVAVMNRLILARYPGRSDMRIGMIACSAWLGQYDEAVAVAQAGIARGGADTEYYRLALATVDSARRVNAPDSTVRLPALAGEWEEVGGAAPRGDVPPP